MARGKKTEENNLSIFDFVDEEKKDIAPRLDVVQMEFVGCTPMSWRELFEGYESLYAITFSSGLGFINELLDQFAYAEVIFGSEQTLSRGLKDILAFQEHLIETIRSGEKGIKEKMITRIREKTARFYVAEKVMSHEKIYLLSGGDGRKRVVFGSANMSFNAFSGKQRENISFIEGDRAYDYYFEVYEGLKKESTDEISDKAIEVADLDEYLDELPFSKKVRQDGFVTIETQPDEEVRFILDTNIKADKLAPLMPKQDKKSKRMMVSHDDIMKIRRLRKEEIVKEKDLRSEYPQLEINIDEGKVTLNDKQMDLSPSQQDIQNDVQLFKRYMDGYTKFHGEVVDLQNRYYEFANWFFCSPFMAVMRDMAARYEQNKLPYPVFGLLYGQSKAGKTTFLETLLKMMIGQKPKLAAPDFTRTSIENLKRTVKGAPIIVDDLTNTRFGQHAVETIKNDDFGIAEHMTNYSAVVISANEDVKAVAPEIVRRTVICRVQAGLTNTEVMKDNIVRNVHQRIGTAFYREYLRRMIDVVRDLLETLKDEEADSAPDILQKSSVVIKEIFSKYCEQLPAYVRELTLEDYFSEKVTSKHATSTIRNAWRTNKGAFKIDSRNNELRYNTGATYEAERLMKELPENLEPRKVRDDIIMNLDAAREFFGLKFKKGIFR